MRQIKQTNKELCRLAYTTTTLTTASFSPRRQVRLGEASEWSLRWCWRGRTFAPTPFKPFGGDWWWLVVEGVGVKEIKSAWVGIKRCAYLGTLTGGHRDKPITLKPRRGLILLSIDSPFCSWRFRWPSWSWAKESARNPSPESAPVVVVVVVVIIVVGRQERDCFPRTKCYTQCEVHTHS